MLIGVILATGFFLGVSAYLDMKAARHHGNMARKQFNDQQMLIARHIRRQVESELSFVGKELVRAGDILSRENGRIDSARPALEPLFSRLLEKVFSALISRCWISPRFILSGIRASGKSVRPIRISCLL